MLCSSVVSWKHKRNIMDWFLFTIAGVWIWVIPCIFFFIILAFAEHEKNFFAFMSLAMFIGIMQGAGIISLFTNPIAVLGWVIVYFIIGGLWSILKWYLFIINRAAKLCEVKQSFVEKINKANIELQLKQELLDVNAKIPFNFIIRFKEYLIIHYFNHHPPIGFNTDNNDSLELVIPRAERYKSRIITWILWWPTSAFWTLLNDPLVKVANWIYNRFQGIYTKITNKVFAKIKI